MPGTHVKTVTVSPVGDTYGWSVVDDATSSTATWVTVTQQGSTDDWDFLVEDNTGSARSATATVTHSNGVTTDSFQIDQAGSTTNTTPPNQMPVLTTDAPTNVNSSGFQANATITTANGTIINRGFLWGTDQNNLTGDVSTTGVSFSANILGLNPNTAYYIQAYAENGYGTGTGNIVAVTTASVPAEYVSVQGTLNPANENENNLTYTVNTTGIAEGVIPTYELEPVSNGFDANDIVSGSLSGNMTPIDANGQSTVTIQYAADQTLEGNETYIFKVTGDNSGNTYPGGFPFLDNRVINDTSTGAPIWTGASIRYTPEATSNISNSAGINEGATYAVVLEGESRPINETIYWSLDSTGYTSVLGQQAGATANDFSNGALGSFTMGHNGDANIGTFALTTIGDTTTEGKEGFTLRFYSDAAMQNAITYPNGLSVKIQYMSLNDTSQGSAANFAWASVDALGNYLPAAILQENVLIGGGTVQLHFVSDVQPTLSDFAVVGANGGPSNPNPTPPGADPAWLTFENPPGIVYDSTTNEGHLQYDVDVLPSGTNTRFAEVTTSLPMLTDPNITYSATATIFQVSFLLETDPEGGLVGD